MKKICFSLLTIFLLSIMSVFAVNQADGGFYCTSDAQCLSGQCISTNVRNATAVTVCSYPKAPTWDSPFLDNTGDATQVGYNGGALLWNGTVLSFNSSNTSISSTKEPIIADLNSDGVPELIASTNNRVSVYSLDATTWTIQAYYETGDAIQFNPVVGQLTTWYGIKETDKQILVFFGQKAYVLRFDGSSLLALSSTQPRLYSGNRQNLTIRSQPTCVDYTDLRNASLCTFKTASQSGHSYITSIPLQGAYTVTDFLFPLDELIDQYTESVNMSTFSGENFASITALTNPDAVVVNSAGSSVFARNYYTSSTNGHGIFALQYTWSSGRLSLSGLDTAFGVNGRLYLANQSGNDPQLDAYSLTAIDTRATGSEYLCVLQWGVHQYISGTVFNTATNRLICYDTSSTETLVREIRNSDIPRSFDDRTKQNSPMGQTHVFTSSGYVYPILCSMFQTSTVGQGTLRCGTWSGSGSGYTNIVDVTATGLIVPQVSTYQSYQSSMGAILSNDTRPVFNYQNVWFFPTGGVSTVTYQATQNVTGVDTTGSAHTLFADVIGDGKISIVRATGSVVQTFTNVFLPSGSTWQSLYLNPLSSNGTWYGYYTTACANTTQNFIGTYCGTTAEQGNTLCQFYDRPYQQFRLGTTCAETQSLTWGNYSPTTPQVSCNFASEGVYSVRVFLQDWTDTQQLDTYDPTYINVFVTSTGCNQAPQLVLPNQTTVINPENPINGGTNGSTGGGGTPSNPTGSDPADIFGDLTQGSSGMKTLFAIVMILAIVFMYAEARHNASTGASASKTELLLIAFVGFITSMLFGLLSWWILIVLILSVVVLILAMRVIFPTTGQ